MKHSIIIICLLVFGCNQTSVDSVDAPQNPFFDLKDYFEKEMKIDRNGITKTTTFEGEKETIQLQNVDLEKELKIFADANLNKVAWYEKYAIVSEKTKEGGTKLPYTIDDPKLKTKRVELFKNNGKLDSILIHNQMTSLIMDSDQFLTYYPNVGYRIRVKQKGKLQDVGNIEINVKY